jgi:2-succinyl-6-hydroxy-2,4-cyclohexadiene-1-carboxylate synthase
VKLDDVVLHVEIDGRGPPLLLLHGFTGSTRTWDEVRPDLAERATLVLLDLIGHGQSAAPPDPERYTLECAVRDIDALLDALGMSSIALVGYSMGGRLALHYAVARPDRVNRLILESASPGIEDPNARQQRAETDEALAKRILRDGVGAFVSEWESLPLLQPGPHVSANQRAALHAQRLNNSPIGLANSLRGMGAGRQISLWSRLSELRMPVQLIVGEQDGRYCDIGRRMQSLLPEARLSVVPDAGHTVHLDQPRQVVKIIDCALDNKLTRV